MKHLPKLFIAFLALIVLGAATPAHAQAVAGAVASVISNTFDVVGTVLTPIGYALMKLMGYVAMLSGVALNAVVYYTIILMAQNFSDIHVIGVAWGVIRDVANMGFIFVLLYASIQLILGGSSENTRRLIVNMIIAAILINFSLFFTRVVIDVANLLALTIYGAIAAPGALDSTNFLNSGISNAFMKVLDITSLYQANALLDGKAVFTITIIISLIMLIAAFVFAAVAIMFVIRYVVLIFVLIFSPIAFVASVFPGLSGPAKQWRDALTSQAFFAPVYFLLTWVALVVARGVHDATFATASFADIGNGSTFSAHLAPALINYSVVITFLIMSLVISKAYSSKAGGVVSKMTSAALGFAGGVTLGTAGRLGRRTLGQWGAANANNEELKKRAANGDIGARLKLAAAVTSSKASFDVRGSKGYEALSGQTGVSFGKPQKGGYAAEVKERAKEFERYKPSEGSKKAVKEALNEAEETLDEARRKAQEKAIRSANVSESEEFKKAKNELNEAEKTYGTPRGISETDEAYNARKAKLDESRKKFEEEKEKYDEKVKESVANQVKNSIANEQRSYEEALGTFTEMDTRIERMAKRAESTRVGTFGRFGLGVKIPFSGNKFAADSIRAANRGKSTKDQAAELVKKMQEESGESEKKEGEKKEGEKKEDEKKEESKPEEKT